MTDDQLERTPECAACDAGLADYLAGRMSERDAERVEAHAAGCARCERILDRATRIPVADFVPSLPVAARANVLAAVTPPARRTQSGARIASWRGPLAGGALLAAAAALLLIARSPSTSEPQGDSARASRDRLPDLSYDGNAAMERAARLASDRAQAEFESLDAAAREIEGALQVSPGDADLRAYLSTVRARRGELMQRVKEATS